jgi:hypothetical protein
MPNNNKKKRKGPSGPHKSSAYPGTIDAIVNSTKGFDSVIYHGLYAGGVGYVDLDGKDLIFGIYSYFLGLLRCLSCFGLIDVREKDTGRSSFSKDGSSLFTDSAGSL